MERQSVLRIAAGLALAMPLTIAATGCRSTRSEVPPRRAHTGDGRQAPMVGFSSEPDSTHPNGFAAIPGSSDGGGGGAPAGMLGMPGSGSGVMGAPTNNAFGPMGVTPPPADVDPQPASAPKSGRDDTPISTSPSPDAFDPR